MFNTSISYKSVTCKDAQHELYTTLCIPLQIQVHFQFHQWLCLHIPASRHLWTKQALVTPSPPTWWNRKVLEGLCNWQETDATLNHLENEHLKEKEEKYQLISLKVQNFLLHKSYRFNYKILMEKRQHYQWKSPFRLMLSFLTWLTLTAYTSLIVMYKPAV